MSYLHWQFKKISFTPSHILYRFYWSWLNFGIFSWSHEMLDSSYLLLFSSSIINPKYLDSVLISVLYTYIPMITSASDTIFGFHSWWEFFYSGFLIFDYGCFSHSSKILNFADEFESMLCWCIGENFHHVRTLSMIGNLENSFFLLNY